MVHVSYSQWLTLFVEKIGIILIILQKVIHHIRCNATVGIKAFLSLILIIHIIAEKQNSYFLVQNYAIYIIGH